MTDERRYSPAELGGFIERPDPLRPADTDADPEPQPATSRAGWLRRLACWLNRLLGIVETDPERNAEYDRIDRELEERGL